MTDARPDAMPDYTDMTRQEQAEHRQECFWQDLCAMCADHRDIGHCPHCGRTEEAVDGVCTVCESEMDMNPEGC